MNVGRPGSIGQRYANLIQQNCDLLISIGARLDYGQTAYNHQHFGRLAKKVIIDIDENEIEKLDMDIEVKVIESAEVVLKALLMKSTNLVMKNHSEWKSYCQRVKDKYPVIKKEYWNDTPYMNPYCFMEELSNQLTITDVIVPGSSGSCSEITMQSFRLKYGQRLYNNEGLGSMGFGIAASLAGCLASGERTIMIDGDGGFQFNIQELETIARLNLPIKMFIINNQGYSAITNMQKNHFGSHFVASDKNSGVTLPDVSKQADVYGIRSFKIHNNSEIKSIIEEVLRIKGPIICDLMVDPWHQTKPRVKSIKLDNGKMESKPMEDMWPFLDKDELKSLML